MQKQYFRSKSVLGNINIALLWCQIFHFSSLFISKPSFVYCNESGFQVGKQILFVTVHTLDEQDDNMSIFCRCAVPRCLPSSIPHHLGLPLSAPTTSRQPGVLICHALSLRPGSPLTHSLLGRRRYASRKTVKPTKRAEELTALGRERHNRNKHSSIKTRPEWVGIAATYAALIVICWSGTTYYWSTHLEKTPVTGRLRFADSSAPQSSSESLPEEALEQLEQIQSLIGPLSQKVRQVFMNIAVAAGVDDREWKVYIIPYDGQLSRTYKPIIYVIFAN